MFNIGGGELLVILLIAVIVLGPDKLPEAARKVGRVTSELRRMSNGFQQEMRDAIRIDPTSSAKSTVTPNPGPTLPPLETRAGDAGTAPAAEATATSPSAATPPATTPQSAASPGAGDEPDGSVRGNQDAA